VGSNPTFSLRKNRANTRQSNNTTSTIYQEFSTINQQLVTPTLAEINRIAYETYPDSDAGNGDNVDAITQDYLNSPGLSSCH
jgi:hypothetical protein